MGNWRTVKMSGSIDKSEVALLRGLCDPETSDSEMAFPFLVGNSLCGLGNWVNDRGVIDACGNLYERDIELDDMLSALEYLANNLPSLTMRVHAGDDYESTDCVATFIVAKGTVTQGVPEVKEIPEISADTMRGRLMSALYGL